MAEKKRLLWVSDTPEFIHVGQSKVSRECVSRLKEFYDVGYAGFVPDPKLAGTETVHDGIPVFRILRTCDDEKETANRLALLYSAIDKFKPDIIVLSHDIFEFPRIQDMKARFPHIKIIGYFTIDGDPIDVRWTPSFDSVDLIWTCSKYGEAAIRDRLFWLDVETIPYGVDHKLFSAIEEADMPNHKTQLAIQTKGKFVGFYIGHNQGRKNLAAGLDGWRTFQKKKSDVMFIVITHPMKRVVGGWGELMQDYDISAFWSPTTFFFDSVYDDQTVTSYMKASDVLIFPTVGEGFGLPLMESMASGCVPIVPNFSGLTDFCRDENSYLMNKGAHVFSNQWMSRRFIVDPDEVAANIEVAYADWKSGKIKSKRAAGLETVKDYSWEKTVSMMVDSIENRVINARKRDRTNKVYRV